MKHSRAFTMIEMLAAIMLLTAFFGVATYALRAVVLATRGAQEQTDSGSRRDRALARLREDVWSARRVRIISTTQLALEGAAEQSIDWQIQGDGSIVRRSDNREERFSQIMPGEVRFVIGPAGARIERSDGASSVPLVCSNQWLREVRP
jgi:prepilin-type N-terminal cleavage/methylation domain-containing protein